MYRLTSWCLLVVLAIGWCAASTPAVAQGIPEFGPLDAGGVPPCLVQLKPGSESAGWSLDAGKRYVVWAAPAVVNQPFNLAAWRPYGSLTPGPARHYMFTWMGAGHGSIGNDERLPPITAVLSKGLGGLRAYNAGTERVWIIPNPLPPGCDADAGSGKEKEGGRHVSSTAAIDGEWLIIANDFPGTMWLAGSSGTVQFEGWPKEQLAGLTIKDNVISFTRLSSWGARYNQPFTGIVKGDTMSGTLTQVSSPGNTYKWSAKRKSK